MSLFAVSGIRIVVSFDAASLRWSQSRKTRKRDTTSVKYTKIFDTNPAQKWLEEVKNAAQFQRIQHSGFSTPSTPENDTKGTQFSIKCLLQARLSYPYHYWRINRIQ
jgi:hypothetical protein